jgi:hypothetical protein
MTRILGVAILLFLFLLAMYRNEGALYLFEMALAACFVCLTYIIYTRGGILVRSLLSFTYSVTIVFFIYICALAYDLQMQVEIAQELLLWHPAALTAVATGLLFSKSKSSKNGATS